MEENKSRIIIYQTENGETKLDVRFQDGTVSLTQKLMAELFQSSIPNINMHLKNIIEEGELEENRTSKEFLIVQQEGSREVKRKHGFYNLDAIISVGTRIKSHIATKFRQWATNHLLLCVSKKKPTAQMAHLVFADTRANTEKTKKACFFAYARII